MDDELMGGFVAGVAAIGFLTLIFCFGVDEGEKSVQKKCDAYGKAKIGEVMYECKKVTT
jgi:hypothetical protein